MTPSNEQSPTLTVPGSITLPLASRPQKVSRFEEVLQHSTAAEFPPSVVRVSEFVPVIQVVE